jgi:penicillin-binding protein 1A
MKTALQDLPVEPFVQPEKIISVRIDKATGKLTTKTDKSSTFEYFIKGTEPKEYVSQDNSENIFNLPEDTKDKAIKDVGQQPPEDDIF